MALARQVDAVGRVVSAYNRQFDLGQRTLSDLLDIRNEFFLTQTTRVTEEFTVYFGVYRTLACMGPLLNTLGVPLPDEATRAAG